MLVEKLAITGVRQMIYIYIYIYIYVIGLEALGVFFIFHIEYVPTGKC